MKRGRNQRRRQGMNINRALDSNGPDVRIRGTANQIYDKYLALARDANSAGDRVKAENYLQHAEHYFRLIRQIQPQMPMQNHQNGEPMDGEHDSQSGYDRNDHNQRRDYARLDSGHPADEDGEGDDGAVMGEERDVNGATAGEMGGERHGRRPEPFGGDHQQERRDDQSDARRGRRRRPRRPMSGAPGADTPAAPSESTESEQPFVADA